MSTQNESKKSLDEIASQYKAGIIKKAKAIESIFAIMKAFQLVTSHETDELAVAFADEHNMSVLTTDQTGRFSVSDFDGNKAFWTGHATSCISVAVMHGNIGIGGAHYNTLTDNDMRSNIAHFFNVGDGDFLRAGGELLSEIGIESYYQTMISPESRQRTCRRAIDDAVGQFNHLRGVNDRRPLPQGTWVGITGIYYLEGSELSSLDTMIKSHVFSAYGKGVSMWNNLGQIGGIAWGGPSHPHLSAPTILAI